jgi:hypothetical protein
VVFALNLVVFLLVAGVWISVFQLYRPKKQEGTDSSDLSEEIQDKQNQARENH